ncbi:DUF2188 domain-containing protein [Macrococcus psychrotolerans]|uniref:DUF2188 domain-containing protein n=1 Tax=Macrococcus psychrotolerans TaxID=3039389 RepID=A0AAU6RI13_9STAP
MMWTMDDYPDTWKHFEQLERKKAIDIANAMLKEGYKESDLIPIATAQAKKWYQSASQEELKELKNKKITLHNDEGTSNPKLMDNDVEVYFEDTWKVRSKGAKRASDSFSTKAEAVKRAHEIADNKGTKVITHNKDT